MNQESMKSFLLLSFMYQLLPRPPLSLSVSLFLFLSPRLTLLPSIRSYQNTLRKGQGKHTPKLKRVNLVKAEPVVEHGVKFDEGPESGHLRSFSDSRARG